MYMVNYLSFHLLEKPVIVQNSKPISLFPNLDLLLSLLYKNRECCGTYYLIFKLRIGKES